jgi:hypothetical protein
VTTRLSLDGACGARFSPCETYRYLLWREWSQGPRALFIMLNPSTATETVDDPTIRRCIGFARSWGLGGVEVANIFALRSTDPRALYRHADPVGPANDDAIAEAAKRAAIVVCAWGNHGRLGNRGNVVLGLLLAVDVQPWCLRMTKQRQPEHPLYQPADRQLVRFAAEVI